MNFLQQSLVLAACMCAGVQGSTNNTLIEYDLPTQHDLRHTLDCFYKDNPFIKKNLYQCDDMHLMWYAKELAKSIEKMFCDKAVSTSQNRSYEDCQNLHAMMKHDRQSLVDQELAAPAPPPLIERTPFPIDLSIQQGVRQGLGDCARQMEIIGHEMHKDGSTDEGRQGLKRGLLSVFDRLRAEARYVLQQSVGTPPSKDKKACKIKIRLLDRKKPEDFTQADLQSLFATINRAMHSYEKPIEGMMNLLGDPIVSKKDIEDVVQGIERLYHSLGTPQKHACDQLCYLTLLEILSHIQKSCALITDPKQVSELEKALSDTLQRARKRPEKGGGMARNLVPSSLFHSEYGLWKSYLDDLFSTLGKNIYRQDFCDNVIRYCGDECKKIEQELIVQEKPSQSADRQEQKPFSAQPGV